MAEASSSSEPGQAPPPAAPEIMAVGALQHKDVRHRIDESTQILRTGVDAEGKDVWIRYCLLGGEVPENGDPDTRPCALFIMGFATSLEGWKPQLMDMLEPQPGQRCPPLRLLCLDNRGVGRSSIPRKKQDYSTALMAQDAKADEVGWRKAHVVGFSMGGMVAARFAASYPDTVLSLSTVASTLGGWHAVPRTRKAWKHALRGMAKSDKRTRAEVDLRFHFTKRVMQQKAPGWGRRKDVLLAEYLHHPAPDDPGTPAAAPPPAAPDPGPAECGQKGHMRAVWKHKLSKQELRALREAEYGKLCIHGRHDLIADERSGRRLAAALGATFVVLEGAHFVSRECGAAVTHLLESAILGQERAVERRHLDPSRHLSPDLPDAELSRAMRQLSLGAPAASAPARLSATAPAAPPREQLGAQISSADALQQQHSQLDGSSSSASANATQRCTTGHKQRNHMPASACGHAESAPAHSGSAQAVPAASVAALNGNTCQSGSSARHIAVAAAPQQAFGNGQAYQGGTRQLASIIETAAVSHTDSLMSTDSPFVTPRGS